MNIVDIVSYLNQPPSLLEIFLDSLHIVLLAGICYLAVWISSKAKPLPEDRAKKYLLWGALYAFLLCLLPYILPRQGILFFLLSLVTSVMHPDMAMWVYVLYQVALRQMVIIIALNLGEYFILRRFAEDRKKLKKALRWQAVISLVLYIIFKSAISFLFSVLIELCFY